MDKLSVTVIAVGIVIHPFNIITSVIYKESIGISCIRIIYFRRRHRISVYNSPVRIRYNDPDITAVKLLHTIAEIIIKKFATRGKHISVKISSHCSVICMLGKGFGIFAESKIKASCTHKNYAVRVISLNLLISNQEIRLIAFINFGFVFSIDNKSFSLNFHPQMIICGVFLHLLFKFSL